MTTAPEHTRYTEFDVVVATSQTAFGAKGIEEVERLVNLAPDWDRVVRMAAYHGVLPLVGQNLASVETVPTDVARRLHGSLVRTAASNLMQAKELGRLKHLFDEADLRIIAFKGPVLASEVYRNLGLRPSTDLDILIESDRYDDVERLLTADGYRKVVRRDAGKIARSVHRYLAQQIPYVKRGNYAIDVHLNVMPPGYDYAYSFDTLYSRSHEVEVGDSLVRGFEWEDLLQVLCYHGIKNRYERLKHVCDIAELIQAAPALNWDTILRRAVETRGEGILILGLYLSQYYFDVSLPKEVEKRVLGERRAHRFGEWVIKRMPLRMEQGMTGFSERFRLYLGIQDTLASKIRYCAYSVLRRLE